VVDTAFAALYPNHFFVFLLLSVFAIFFEIGAITLEELQASIIIL